MRAWQTARQSTTILETFQKRALSHSCVSRQRQSIAGILRNGTNAEQVYVNGWVRSLRKQKRVAFAAVGDGSTVDSLQAVLRPEDAAGSVNSLNLA